MTRDFYRVLQQLVNTVNTLRGEILTVEDAPPFAIAAPASGQILVYDGTFWINSNLPAVSDLSDVLFTGLAPNDFFMWDGTNWINVP